MHGPGWDRYEAAEEEDIEAAAIEHDDAGGCAGLGVPRMDWCEDCIAHECDCYYCREATPPNDRLPRKGGGWQHAVCAMDADLARIIARLAGAA